MSRATIGLFTRLLLPQLRTPRPPSLCGSDALTPSTTSSTGRVVGAVALGGWRNVQSNAVVPGTSSSISSDFGDHTSKWMTKFDKKSPRELIAEVPPIEVGARVVACEGGRDPALGHPVEYISLDLPEPNVCKYCGLRYVQAHHHHHRH